jgi:hypothetical protein
MSKSALADAIVVSHFVWIFYVVIGQLFILLGIALGWRWIRNFWFRFTHLTMMLLVAVETLFAIDCPLTIWEKRLRGFSNYETLRYTEADGFIAQWFGRMVFCDVSTSAWPYIISYLTFTMLVVWSFWKAPPTLGMSKASFAGLVHATIGAIMLAASFVAPLAFGDDADHSWGVGVCFLIQGWLWYALQNRPRTHEP